MRRKFKIKKKYLIFMIVILCSITIGFSYLSTSLSLSGNLTVKGGLFDVTFDAKGGNIVNPVRVLLNGTNGSLPETVREGYDFLGWYTEESDGDKITSYDDVDSNITLYAQWEAHEHTLTINNNGGSGCSNQTKKYDEVWEACTPTKNGYTLSSWSTDFGGQKVTGDVSTTANWTPTNYTITWNLNSGSLSGQKTSYNIETANYTLPTPTRSGYDFGGWFENSGLTGTAVTSLAKGSTGNKTYYAKWSAATYKVTLDNQSATTAGTASVNVTYGSTTLSNITVPKRTGYTFGGYYTSTGGSGTQRINASGVWVNTTNTTFTAATTLYAKWTAQTYKVTLDNQSATTAGTASVNVTYGSTTLSNITVPKRTGYTFGGYYTSTGGSGTQRINASGVWVNTTNKTFTAATTLYAKWTVVDTTPPGITDIKAIGMLDFSVNGAAHIGGNTIKSTFSDTGSGLAGYFITSNSSNQCGGTAPSSWHSISGTSYDLSTSINTAGTIYVWVKDKDGNTSCKQKELFVIHNFRDGARSCPLNSASVVDANSVITVSLDATCSCAKYGTCKNSSDSGTDLERAYNNLHVLNTSSVTWTVSNITGTTVFADFTYFPNTTETPNIFTSNSGTYTSRFNNGELSLTDGYGRNGNRLVVSYKISKIVANSTTIYNGGFVEY